MGSTLLTGRGEADAGRGEAGAGRDEVGAGSECTGRTGSVNGCFGAGCFSGSGAEWTAFTSETLMRAKDKNATLAAFREAAL